jgi:hypothetical protein
VWIVVALTLETVRTVALLAAVGFVIAAIGAAILAKSIAQKAALAVIFILLGALMWTQRVSLERCAESVRAAITVGSTASRSVTCSFFGQDVKIANGDQT